MAEVTLFAAANLTYFYQHGYAFAKSAVDAGNYVHIIVWKDNKDEWTLEQKKFMEFMIKFHEKVDPEFCKVQLLSHNTIYEFKKNLVVNEERALFACVRFLMLESVVNDEYMLNNRGVVVMDIDSIVNKKIEIPDEYDLGVFLRHDEVEGTEYEKQGMKVAAGMLYVTPTASEFIQALRSHIIGNSIQWFCDQVAIHQAYLLTHEKYNVLNFNGDDLDWNFEEGTSVWTGKGRRKTDSVPYVTKKNEIEKDFLL